MSKDTSFSSDKIISFGHVMYAIIIANNMILHSCQLLRKYMDVKILIIIKIVLTMRDDGCSVDMMLILQGVQIWNHYVVYLK